MIERHCDLARTMSERLFEESGINVLNEVALNQFVMRRRGAF